MDILKLLTRSTKQIRKPASNAQQPKLPSAGTTANPQLYNDPVPDSAPRGTKRKLVDRQNGLDVSNTTAEELNFFAPKTENQKPKKENVVTEPIANNAAPVLLDQDDCRRVLLSHRLKVTLLPVGAVADSNSEKLRKKSKKRKSAPPEVVKKKKGEFKQIHPQPLVAFEDLRTTYGLSRRLAENITNQGYRLPTEVQLGTLPLQLRPDLALHDATENIPSLERRTNLDILAVAPTGSGKTIAFLIPIIEHMVQRRREKESAGHSLESVVVAPTKELANQIVNEGRKLALGTGIKVVGMRKGMRVVEGLGQSAYDKTSDDSSDDEEDESDSVTNEKPRRSASQPVTKADILVTTPLVLLNALSASSGADRSPLPTVRHLILDEADVLLDPLFREQTLGIWEACTHPELNVTLWSATMGSNVETLASDTIAARRQRLKLKPSTPIIRVVVGLKDSAIPNITHRLIYAANESGKLIGLRQLLHPTAPSPDASLALRPPFLVFTQTIPRAIALHSELLYDIPPEAGGSARIAVLHSDLSDPARDAIMTRFRNGDVWILITTDILSRGVDFRGINGVVNYDIPNSGAAYIHRVGRTGRAGRDGGVAVTFYTKEDIPFVKNVANIIAASEKQAGKSPSESSMQQWLLDALPTPSKRDKKNLKLHGVEARKSFAGTAGSGRHGSKADGKKPVGKGLARMRISTKSGYERRMEHNRRGAIEGSKRRVRELQPESKQGGDVSEGEWGGIED